MGSGVTSVVFDFGGVIITPITNQISDLASDLGCSVEVLREVLMGPSHESGSHPWHRLERGEIDQHELQDALAPYAAALAVPWRGDEVERVLAPGQFTVHDEMIERIRSLRDRGYRTGLLSNSIREFRPKLESHAPPSLFDVYVDSSEVGRRKPEPEIFSILLDSLGEIDPGRVSSSMTSRPTYRERSQRAYAPFMSLIRTLRSGSWRICWRGCPTPRDDSNPDGDATAHGPGESAHQIGSHQAIVNR